MHIKCVLVKRICPDLRRPDFFLFERLDYADNIVEQRTSCTVRRTAVVGKGGAYYNRNGIHTKSKTIRPNTAKIQKYLPVVESVCLRA